MIPNMIKDVTKSCVKEKDVTYPLLCSNKGLFSKFQRDKDPGCSYTNKHPWYTWHPPRVWSVLPCLGSLSNSCTWHSKPPCLKCISIFSNVIPRLISTTHLLNLNNQNDTLQFLLLHGNRKSWHVQYPTPVIWQIQC